MMTPLRQSFACFILAFTAAHLSAATVTLRPNAGSDGTTNGDAFVTTGPSGNLSGFNYGGAGALAVSATGSAAGGFSSFLRFDAAAAKSAFDLSYGSGGWILDSVVLQLTTTNANNPIFNSNAAGSFSVQWIPAYALVEGSGTPAASSTDGVRWADVPNLITGAETGGTFPIVSIADGVTANYTLTPSTGLLQDITGGGPVSLFLAPADTAMSAVFNSRSFGNASRNPALILTASPVPEPGAPVLLAIVTWAMGCRRKRA